MRAVLMGKKERQILLLLKISCKFAVDKASLVATYDIKEALCLFLGSEKPRKLNHENKIWQDGLHA